MTWPVLQANELTRLSVYYIATHEKSHHGHSKALVSEGESQVNGHLYQTYQQSRPGYTAIARDPLNYTIRTEFSSLTDVTIGFGHGKEKDKRGLI
jgi:hypothetical protein